MSRPSIRPDRADEYRRLIVPIASPHDDRSLADELLAATQRLEADHGDAWRLIRVRLAESDDGRWWLDVSLKQVSSTMSSEAYAGPEELVTKKLSDFRGMQGPPSASRIPRAA